MTVEERLADLEARVEDLEEQLEIVRDRASARADEARVVEAALRRQVMDLEYSLSDERAERQRAERKQQSRW